MRRRGIGKGRRRLVATCCAVLLLLCLSISLAAQNPAAVPGHGEYERADIEQGFLIYNSRCVTCHGPGGDSIPGVDFRSGRFKNAASDDDLRRIITNGVPGTPMPSGKFAAPELTALVAFIRSIGDFDAKPVAVGDAQRGRSLVEGKGGCLTCHRIKGKGSAAGPDLGAIGSQRTAFALQQSIVEPARALLPSGRSVRVVTADGKTIVGRRLNEDTHSVQIVSEDGRLLSLAKSDLREFTILTAPRMPSYQQRLDTAEVADIVAYLISLKL